MVGQSEGAIVDFVTTTTGYGGKVVAAVETR